MLFNEKSEKIIELIKDGKLDEALMSVDANDVEILIKIGALFGTNGVYDIADKIFDRVIQLNPNIAKVWSNKGNALDNLGKYTEALKCYDEAITINPNLAEVWSNKGIALDNLGKYTEALKCYDEAITINPNYAEAWYNKGNLLVNLGKYAEAIKCYDEAIKINPNLTEAWSNKGIALGNLGRHAEAIKCYDEAIKINPNYAEAWYNKGNALVNLGKYAEALNCYDEAIKINHDDADSWSNKGNALVSLGKYAEAINCYDEAIKINPNLTEAWSNKGIALGNLGRHDEALKCYDEAIKINPNFAEAWSNKGIALGNFGRHDEAIKCYDEAIKINPNFAEAYGNLGFTLLTLHNYDNAIVNFRKAKELFSKRTEEKDADKAYKYEVLAQNSSNLMNKLEPLDKEFLNSLNAGSLVELKEKSCNISKSIQDVIHEFEKVELSQHANHLLINKSICFTALSDAINFKKVNLNKLEKAKEVFKERGINTFIIVVNSLVHFVYGLEKYKSLEEIPKIEEEFLLQVLKISHTLYSKLTDETTIKIIKEPFTVMPKAVRREKEPTIIYKYIADTEKEWVKFCLVQLDFSLVRSSHEKFRYILKEDEKEKIKNKVFRAIDIARENNVDLICFPELSFLKEWVNEIENNNYRDMIIIGGSYYDDEYNVCPIIIDGKCIDPPYMKCYPSPIENPETTGHGMKSGNILYVLQTKCGSFSVLTCIDYTYQSYSVCKYKCNVRNVDFIINPCCDENISRFQPRCNLDCRDFEINIIQVNKANEGESYGKSCIICKENKIILEKLKNDGFKPPDEIKYKVFQLDGEMMGIAELNIKETPPVDIPPNYFGRIKVRNEGLYKYEKGDWSHLPDK